MKLSKFKTVKVLAPEIAKMSIDLANMATDVTEKHPIPLEIRGSRKKM